MTTTSTAARYRFSDSARAGVLLGMGLRQAAPLVAGMLWLILMLSIGLPALGIVGPVLGAVIAFGRWKHAPLYEVAVPGVRLLAARWRGRRTWTRASLLAVGNGAKEDLPKALRGVTLREVEIDWMPAPCTIGVVTDKTAGALSLVVGVSATGFPVASSSEQDGLVAAWGSALGTHCTGSMSGSSRHLAGMVPTGEYRRTLHVHCSWQSCTSARVGGHRLRRSARRSGCVRDRP